MAKSLVIVESPSKARTIKKYLGRDFRVEASSGHLVDLPSSSLGVDIQNDFKPKYSVIKGKTKYLENLKKASRDAEKVYLASDPDREGEAIAWHIANRLNLWDKVHRVLIHEITEAGVRESMSRPLAINIDRFESQQARRILDRIVGYKVSPVLWKKVKKGLSAGRVQSVALRFVVDREREIQNFKPREYWTLDALVKKIADPDADAFTASLHMFRGKKAKIENAQQSEEIVSALSGKDFVIGKIEKKERKRNPLPPFITSTLQQDSSKKYRFSVKKTMLVAQGLYEGVELGSKGPVGLITYMRTDSVRASDNAVAEARGFISENYGGDYVPRRPNTFKVKKSAQDAHECIRPTFPSRRPEDLRKFLTEDQYKLYSLIWKRFIASQMSPAVYDQTRVDITAGEAVFRATGNVMKFPGFTAAYEEATEKEETSDTDKNSKRDQNKRLPELSEKDILSLLKLDPKQHFTQPPPRYSESSLVKELEEKGIGRPSTYASILSTIQDRGYAERQKARFVPTPLGFSVNDFLVEGFPGIMNEEFTARMESDLDRVEEGEVHWVELLRGFYDGFSKSVTRAEEEIEGRKLEIPTDIECDKCEASMVIREGRYGQFLSCSRYPECKNAKDFTRAEDGEIVVGKKTDPEICDDIECDKCGAPMVIKEGRYGQFLSCSKYPDCKNPKEFTRQDGRIVIKQKEPPEVREDIKCEKCGKPMVVRRSRRGRFLGCSGYPKCKSTLNLDKDGNIVRKATKAEEV
ncbi:MAG: type I DNA topoisomerase [Candidatus Dadabacteria bacterium]|nr:type I DNA topoisomerase [Candidatus Dadabacteria bacterium]MDE0663725.1 type I DNA topoisomerase [Candidatus Dadabacteria bacterium]